MQAFDRITIDPKVFAGKPCIRDMRFPVSEVLQPCQGATELGFQGQRCGRCRVRRRAERVSRPAREKNRRRRVLVVAICSNLVAAGMSAADIGNDYPLPGGGHPTIVEIRRVGASRGTSRDYVRSRGAPGSGNTAVKTFFFSADRSNMGICGFSLICPSHPERRRPWPGCSA